MAYTINPQSNIDAINSASALGFVFTTTSGGTVFSSNLKTSASFDYFSDTAVVNDSIYVAVVPSFISFNYWHNITFNIGTALAGTGITFAIEYHNGTAWVAVPNAYDDTNGFTATGSKTIYFEMPSGARKIVVNGGRYVWIRIRIATLTTITEGGANATDKVKVNTGFFQTTTASSNLLSDLWTADKAVTREIMNPRAAAASMTPYMSLYPAEWGTIKLSLIITGLSEAGNVTITGKDASGSAATEVVAISADGTYVTANSYASIDASGISCTGTYTIQITQPRMGCIWKMDTYSYIIYKTNLLIGDNSTTLAFSDYYKNIYIREAGILVMGNATLTFGSLSSSVLQYPMSIQHWAVLTSNSYDYFIAATGTTAVINLYNTCVDSPSTSRFMSYAGTIRGCKFAGIYDLIINGSGVSISDTVVNYTSIWTFAIYANAITLSDVKSEGSMRGILCYAGGSTDYTNANIPKLVRPKSIGCTYDITLYVGAGLAAIIIDPEFTLVSTKLSVYAGGGTTFKIFLDYTVNLKVVDEAGNGISGATITLNDNTGSQKFSVTTDANGVITEQRATAKIWSHAWAGANAYTTFTDADITDYSPFILTISKSGYKTYKSKLTLAKKFDEIITLSKVKNLNLSKSAKIVTQ